MRYLMIVNDDAGTSTDDVVDDVRAALAEHGEVEVCLLYTSDAADE